MKYVLILRFIIKMFFLGKWFYFILKCCFVLVCIGKCSLLLLSMWNLLGCSFFSEYCLWLIEFFFICCSLIDFLNLIVEIYGVELVNWLCIFLVVCLLLFLLFFVMDFMFVIVDFEWDLSLWGIRWNWIE